MRHLVLSWILSLCAAVSVAAHDHTRFGDSDPVVFKGKNPASFAVHGIDVARFQDKIDWRKAKSAGVQFAFIKATEGGDLRDPMFDRHWDGAKRAGVPAGAYHFYYFCTSAATQARWFIRNVPKTRGMLPPVLDMEWNAYSPTCKKRPPGAVVRREAAVFLKMLERHYGQKPIIYTTPGFYRDTGIGRLRGYDFWLRAVAETPQQVYPGQNWQFWQYTGTGTIPGIAGNVDINVFGGSRADWHKWLGAHRR